MMHRYSPLGSMKYRLLPQCGQAFRAVFMDPRSILNPQQFKDEDQEGYVEQED